MCNKNFADTVMMSYNVIYSVQKKNLAVSEGGSLTGVGLSGFYWIWALYLERVGKAFLGFEINVLFKIGLLFVVLFGSCSLINFIQNRRVETNGYYWSM